MNHIVSKKKERQRIDPYFVQDAGLTVEEVGMIVNGAQYDTYSHDYKVGLKLNKFVVNPLYYYKELLIELLKINDSLFHTMEDVLSDNTVSKDNKNYVIRHDVDGDIFAALEMAKIENELGIRSTYYILHTAYYYGYIKDGVFFRYDCMANIYKEIQDLGHEVSLHTDPLLLYQDYCLDGAQAVVKEIEWLRSRGIKIPGSAAHNNPTVYGAQNFEIFEGRYRNFIFPGNNKAKIIKEDEVFFNGKWAPLHVLSENDLGLCYEAHDAYTLECYLGISSEIGFNSINQTWSSKVDKRKRDLTTGPDNRFSFYEEARKVQYGELLILTSHPLYYGSRVNSITPPPIKSEHAQIIQNKELGWSTYLPNSLVSHTSPDTEKRDFQTIHFANEYGMISRPFPESMDVNTLKVFLIGGNWLLSNKIGLPDHLEVQLEKLLTKKYNKKSVVRTFSGKDMGVDRYYQWLEIVLDKFNPEVVVLELDFRLCHQNWLNDYVDNHQSLGKKKRFSNYIWVNDESLVSHCSIKDKIDISRDSETIDINLLLDKYMSLFEYAIKNIRKNNAVPLIIVTDYGDYSFTIIDYSIKQLESLKGTRVLDVCKLSMLGNEERNKISKIHKIEKEHRCAASKIVKIISQIDIEALRKNQEEINCKIYWLNNVLSKVKKIIISCFKVKSE